MQPLHVTYIGNFQPPHSTENHVAAALRHNGVHVRQLQESDERTWYELAERAPATDVILWTRTGWGWSNPGKIDSLKRRMMDHARDRGIPVVGYHLDIWWGLKRQVEVETEPFFEVDLLVTADGGHDDHWKAMGVHHVWFPPGVSQAECQPGMWRNDFAHDIVFVGSWQGDYHPEHTHRFKLLEHLAVRWGDQLACYPRIGQPAVRGADLRDLYATAKVVVGDSCFAGQGVANYWSDRVPETVGRGGYLLHPEVPGLEDHFESGTHLDLYEPFNWDQLDDQIDYALRNVAECREIGAAGRRHVLENHTYEVRMSQLVRLLRQLDLLHD